MQEKLSFLFEVWLADTNVEQGWAQCIVNNKQLGGRLLVTSRILMIPLDTADYIADRGSWKSDKVNRKFLKLHNCFWTAVNNFRCRILRFENILKYQIPNSFVLKPVLKYIFRFAVQNWIYSNRSFYQISGVWEIEISQVENGFIIWCFRMIKICINFVLKLFYIQSSHTNERASKNI